MAAFDFPAAPVDDGTRVTNDVTGITYEYDAASDSWNIVSSALGESVNSQITTLSQDIGRIDGEIEEALEERDDLIANAISNNVSQNERIAALEIANVTYQLQTDKILGSGEPSINLVDSADFFSNVKIKGTGGIAITSDASSIIVDGSGIDAGGNVDVDLSNYYTKSEVYTKTEVNQADSHLQDQIDELTVTKGSAAVYTLNDIGIQVGIRPGDFYIDNTVAKNVSFLALAPEDNNGNDRPLGDVGDIIEIVGLNNRSYRYTITTASDGIAGVEFLVAAHPDDLLIAGTTFTIYIYPQNKTTASLDYVDSSVEPKADKTYVDEQLSFKADVAILERDYLTTSDANKNYLKDGSTTNNLMINRTAGGSIDSMKVTNITGGATVWRLDAKAGSNGPVIYKTEGTGYHNFVGKVNFDRVGDTQQGFKIEGRKSDGTVGDLFFVYHNGGDVADAVNYNGKIASDNNIATKKYVDNAVAGTTSLLAIEDAEPDIHYGDTAPTEAGNGDLWVDTSEMRLLMYVGGAWVNPDRQDSTVDLSPYQKIVSPPGRKFKKVNATNPNESGTFTYYETGGQLKLGINRRDAEGTRWLDINFNDSLNAPVLFRIIQWQSDTQHKTVRYGAIDKIVASDGGQVVCDVKYHSTNGSLSNGSNYFITIGGLI